jgi:ABC-type nitrate/sulfonate/bicarbonate transport system substrate-binding protein
MIEISIFPNTTALALYVARDRGLFAGRNIEVNITTTPDSIHQMSGLMDGVYDIATTAVDNTIAYQEGQGAVIPETPPDLFVFMGVARMGLQLVVPAHIQSYADLGGKTLVVDALETGFTFLLRAMLERGGLGPGEFELAPVGSTPQRWAALQSGAHDGALLTDNFTQVALDAGYRVLENSIDVIAPYASQAATARRGWAARNPALLTGFIGAYVEAVRYILDPANEPGAAEILGRNRPNMTAEATTAAVRQLRSSREGLLPDARLDIAGVRTVLDLRSRFADPPRSLTDPGKYIDLSYWEAALADNERAGASPVKWKMT